MKPFAVMRLATAAAGGGGPDPGGGGGDLTTLAVSPIACYSLRKLIGTATQCVRVQRSSDSTEQDIGFSGGSIDTAALAAFVGVGSGYVTTFYDQTGHGFHAVTGGPTNSPKIVNAGTYLGFVSFDGSNDTLIVTAPTLGNAQAGFYTRLAQPSSGLQVLWELSPNYNSNPQSLIVYADSGSFAAGMNDASGGTQRRNDYAFSLSAMSRFTMLFDRSLSGASEIKAFIGGALQTPVGGASYEQGGTFDQGHNLFIAGRAGNFYAAMSLETFVLYNVDTSAIQTEIEDIIG